MGNILYIGLKLDEQSKLDLIEVTDELFGDTHPKTYCDHLTLAFGRQCNEFDTSMFGMKATLNSNKIAYDDKCVALVIDKVQVEEFGVNNEHPHITMATDEMTKPVYSNDLIKGEHEIVELDHDLVLNCEVTPVYR